MIGHVRQQQILTFLEKNKNATVRELTELLHASESSVRRDLEKLENEGLARRVHGGVILSEYRNSVAPLSYRDAENHAIKERLAQRAAAIVQDGATILIDSSSTTWRIVKYLKNRRNLRIITNSLAVFKELESDGIEAYCTGGLFRTQTQDFVGHEAESYIRSVYADFLFFSSNAISLDGEISDVSAEWTSLRRVMLTRARRRVFVCDSSKIGERRVFTLCTKDDIDDIICDTPLPWEIGEAIKK